MGGACGRCSEVEKKQGNTLLPGPELEHLEADDDEHEEHSEVHHSSDGEPDPEEYRKDVVETLVTTGVCLKRGKTMAMREAISTAKKIGVEQGVIENAERQLDEHKQQQKRDAVTLEVQHLFESKRAREIPQVQRMIKKAEEADCADELIEKLHAQLDMLIITRPLENAESDQAREYMKQSCFEFVMRATKGGGRPVVFLNLMNGSKLSAMVTLDAVLQNIILTIDDKEEKPLIVPVLSVVATRAVNEDAVRSAKGFKELEEADVACAVVVKYEVDGKPGYWCLIEPTVIRKDRLIEAFGMLSEACRVA